MKNIRNSVASAPFVAQLLIFKFIVMFSKDNKLRDQIESYLINELHERNVMGRYSSYSECFFFNLFAKDILIRLKLDYWKHL